MMNQNFWMQEGMPSDREQIAKQQSHVKINVPENPSNHIRSIDEAYVSSKDKPPKA